MLGYVIGVAGGILGGYALALAALPNIFEPLCDEQAFTVFRRPRWRRCSSSGLEIWHRIEGGAGLDHGVLSSVFYNVYTGVRSVEAAS